MNLLSVQNLGKEIGHQLLFKEVNFGINSDDKIGLIGNNGSGKSTLLKLIAGRENSDSGQITCNKEIKIAVLDQITEFDPDQTILDFILSSENLRFITLKQYLKLSEEISNSNSEHDPELNDRLERLQTEMERFDGFKIASEVRELLFQFHIKDTNTPMRFLSGGMVKKAALARLLLSEANLILLDEPTNHLDIATIYWLEEFLIKTGKAILLITHDRYFLDNVVNNILEIDNGKITKFQGNYDRYLAWKVENAMIENRTLEKQKKLLRLEQEWLSRMPKARGTKQKARIATITATQSVVAGHKAKAQMESFSSADLRLGKRILEVKNISKSFDNSVIFPEFSFQFKKKDRIGILGENGSGKTTFLKILMNQLEPDTGKVIPGVNTLFGYLSQTSKMEDPNQTIIAAVKQVANYFELEDGTKITATQLLERFLFIGEKQYQKISKLSGGEKRRLDIILLLMTNPNFLILDEPTNDLDLTTLNLLEEYLLDFPGCLLIVSHDRFFLDKVCDSLLIFDKGQQIRWVNGSCSDYVFTMMEEKKIQRSRERNSQQQENTSPKKDYTNRDKKLSYKQSRRKAELEKEIPLLEAKIKELETKLNSGEADSEKLKIWGNEYNAAETLLFDLLHELEQIEKIIE